jgi:hypothetical protein
VIEVVVAVLLLPYALAGLVVNAVPLVSLAAVRRAIAAPAVMATVLPLAAAALFGLTWAGWVGWVWSARGGGAAAGAALLMPVLFGALLGFAERAALGARALAGVIGRRARRAGGLRSERELLVRQLGAVLVERQAA